MEWLSDPTVWVGLATLVVLEIVLGIDNLIFIAILTDKLPPSQSNRARVIGLSLALIMRIGLLFSISWVMSLKAPLFTVFDQGLSWRDLILIGGGAFLIIKSTIEMHDRLEAKPYGQVGAAVHGRFWSIVAQIVVLDAVFSLDSIITAIGMVDELYVMIAAVVIAMGAMLVASKPLSKFINDHPTLVILCLGFLLMIGLVLVVDGVGYHIPKGYVYAAISFSVLIEGLNQFAQYNRQKRAASIPQRQRVADAVLRLLAGVPIESVSGAKPETMSTEVERPPNDVFTPDEKRMVKGVLALRSRPVETIMTPRPDVEWIDIESPVETVVAQIRHSPHREFIVGRGSIDEVVGIARKDDLLALALDGPFDIGSVLRQPAAVPEHTSIFDALNLFKEQPIEIAIVVDEYGGLRGVVTRTDFLESIAGDLRESEDEKPQIQALADQSFSADGSMSIYDAQEELGLGSLPEGDFHTLAGLVVHLLGHIPTAGDSAEWKGWRFEVAGMDGLRVDRVIARRIAEAKAAIASPDQS